jgi:hypothetical protein
VTAYEPFAGVSVPGTTCIVRSTVRFSASQMRFCPDE